VRRELESLETQLVEASARVAALEDEVARLSAMVRRVESERDSLRQEGEGKEEMRVAARSKEEEVRALVEQVQRLEAQAREGEERMRVAQKELEEHTKSGRYREESRSEISGRETSRSSEREGRKASCGAESEREGGASAREIDGAGLFTPPSAARVPSFFESEAASTSPRIMEPRLVPAPTRF